MTTDQEWRDFHSKKGTAPPQDPKPSEIWTKDLLQDLELQLAQWARDLSKEVLQNLLDRIGDRLGAASDRRLTVAGFPPAKTETIEQYAARATQKISGSPGGILGPWTWYIVAGIGLAILLRRI